MRKFGDILVQEGLIDADELKNILATGGGGGMQLPGHAAQGALPTRGPPGR